MKGESDENDKKIQIHAPESGILAVGSYVTAYDSGYYYPTAYYTPDYDYYSNPYSYYEYGPRYSRTVVRSGARYYDSYGARYYGY